MRKKYVWTNVAMYGLYLVGGYFCVLNISPYVVAVGALSTPIRGLLLSDLGRSLDWVNALGLTVQWAIATLIWGAIQVTEVLPLILLEDDRFLEALISVGSGGRKYVIDAGDDPLLNSLKKLYNRIPLKLIRNLYVAQVFTYTVDFLIVLSVYPPAPSASLFLKYLLTGAWGAVDWGNVALAAVTLFSVEVIVLALLWAGRLRAVYILSRSTGGGYEG
jgi:hypothetical protein